MRKTTLTVVCVVAALPLIEASYVWVKLCAMRGSTGSFADFVDFAIAYYWLYGVAARMALASFLRWLSYATAV